MSINPQVRKEFGRLAALLVVVGTLATSLVAASFAAFDPVHPPDRWSTNDPARYLANYFGNPTESHAQYRQIVPYLTRLLPDPPVKVLFEPNRRFVEGVSIPAFKFAVVNLVFLIGSGVVLYYLVRGFGLTDSQSLLAPLLFLSLPVVVVYSGMPMTEPGYFFCLALAALAVQRQNAWVLMVALLVGVFVNEQVLFAILLVVLAPFSWTRRLRLLATTFPAVALYALVRFWLAPTSVDFHASGQFLSNIPKTVQFQLTPYGLGRFLYTFGLLWVPCLYAAVRCPLHPLLRRWAWFIFLVFVAIVALGVGPGGVSRHLSATFVVVIPLALVGLSDWAGWNCGKEPGTETNAPHG